MRHCSDIPRRSNEGMNAAPPTVRRRNSPPFGVAAADDPWLAPAGRHGWPGALRASRRLLLLVLWTLFAMPIQAVCLLLPGMAKVRFAQLYWRGIVRVLGVRVRVVGAPEVGSRPVLFVSNHSSWVDIGVLGGVLPGCFVAKGEIDNWPVIKWIARLGRTVFVSRRRNATGRVVYIMRERFE
ncbi:MAG: 1-acyl-sn-glycerol-3-phosphate acyltransferase, partial [Acetobacteraceae bacterium]